MKLYLKYFSIQLQSQMQYKLSFLFTLIGQFSTSFAAFLSVYFMFARFHEIDGFTYQQVLLCFAVVLMSFSLAECFARGFDRFAVMIGNGEFDRILVRPRNEIFQILATKIELTRLGRLLQAVIIFSYAIPASNVIWDGTKLLLLSLMVLSGTVVFSGLFTIYAAICFFTTEGLEFMNIFTDGGREFGSYPVSIYGGSVLRFLTYVVPLALFQYYPFLFLIGRSNNPLYALSPCLAFFFLLPCYAFWRFGLRQYKSTGS